MKLIDADELIEIIEGNEELVDWQKKEFVNCINACDTAYDVDAVVEQLEEMKKECKDSLQDYDPEYFIDRAIESAKGGGVDG